MTITFALMSKPSLPSGTRDFGPLAALRRKYIFQTIERVFQLHGFQPIETPAMENLSTLTGKYGDEGDQLIYKILNSADYLAKADAAALAGKDSKKLLPSIAEKALRYDLTVPFARFVVMNRNNLSMPFRRYQIQPVWRADRPQKGRYREFYQCDVDIIGSTSMANEAELIQVFGDVFSALNMEVDILMNHRGLLEGFFQEACRQAKMEATEKGFAQFTVILDKLDKIGFDGVITALKENGFDRPFIAVISPVIEQPKRSAEYLNELQGELGHNDIAAKALKEIKQVYSLVGNTLTSSSNLVLDLSLARGLSYYTGCIFEVKTREGGNSICGGGRYDNLTGIFGMDGLSGVGISFGADRIYDYLEQHDLFPKQSESSTQVIFCCFEEEGLSQAVAWAHGLRQQGIAAEVYPGTPKIGKQLDYANARNIPFAVLIGSNELTTGALTVKNLISGEQSTVKSEDLGTWLVGNTR